MNVVKNRPSNLTLEINVGSREAVVVVDDDLNESENLRDTDLHLYFNKNIITHSN